MLPIKFIEQITRFNNQIKRGDFKEMFHSFQQQENKIHSNKACTVML